MKKMVILSPSEEEISENKVKEFIDYSIQNNFEIVGEIHYSPFMTLKQPELFAEMLKDRGNDCVFIFDDLCPIMASVYTNGKLLDYLAKENIHVKELESNCELSDIYKTLDNDFKSDIKNAIDYALNGLKREELSDEKFINIAIIYNEDDRAIESFIKDLGYEKNVKVFAIKVAEFIKEMVPLFEKMVAENNIEEVYVFDEDIVSAEMSVALMKLSLKYNFDLMHTKVGIDLAPNEMKIN